MHYQDLIKQYPRYLGFGFLHTFFSSIGQTFLIALFLPHVRQVFHQSEASMGSYYGMVTLASALTLFFTGPWIDKLNLRLYSIAVGLVVSLGCIGIVLAPNLGMVIVALYLIRHGGQALMSHTAFTTMSRYFTVARGKALGIAGLGIALGEAILPLLVALLIGRQGWRFSYVVLAGCTLLVFLPLSLFLVNRNDDIQHPHVSQADSPLSNNQVELNWGRRQLLSNSYFWLLVPLLIVPPCLGTGFFYFQAHIAAAKGWSPELFASCFLSYGISSAAMSFLSGPWVDRWGGTRLLPFTLLPMIGAILSLLYIDHIVAGHLFMVWLGMSFGAVGNVRSSMWAEVYGRLHLGSIKSFASMVMVFSTALAPPIGGWLIDRGSTIQELLWGCIWIVLGATLLAFVARPPTLGDDRS